MQKIENINLPEKARNNKKTKKTDKTKQKKNKVQFIKT